MLSARCFGFALLSLLPVPAALAGTTLDRIHAAKSISCGVIKEEEDYSRATDHGNRAAFDLDLCKAVAVATLGVGAHFTISVFPDEPAGIKALHDGRVDLLPSASPSVGNMTANSIAYGPTTFHDGESIMVPIRPAIHSATELAGKKICFVITSESETGLRTYAARKHLSYIWYPFSEVGEMEAAFFTGNCAGLAGDVSQLANTRAITRTQAPQYTILPEIFRQDPLAPAYSNGDPQFGAVVQWTIEALLQAEELGVTQSNLATMRKSEDPEIQQLLGRPLGTGRLLGLDAEWAAHVIAATGNYGEIFDRDLGAHSPLGINRGEDQLWPAGAMLARPLREP